MLCATAIDTSNTISTQTGATERQSSGLDTNSQWRRSWGIRGVKGPHFPEWGVTYKTVTPSFYAMLMSLFSLYILVMDGDGCR